MALTLGKYEALGNDFLVLIDPGGVARFDAALAAGLCDRRRGVGADGLLRVGVGGPGRITMALRNADGGLAETSGNGLRCAVLAACDAGLVTGQGPVHVRTGAGEVTAVLGERTRGAARLRAEMGHCVVVEEASPVPGWQAFSVDVGNPHLVLIAGESAPPLDLAEVGPRLERSRPAGVNVELVRLAGPDRLAFEVWERGAGATLACGSGSCAAAAAARRLGLVGDEVVVDNPGGRLVVFLDGEPAAPAAELEGPARRVATVILDDSWLAGLAAGTEDDVRGV